MKQQHLTAAPSVAHRPFRRQKNLYNDLFTSSVVDGYSTLTGNANTAAEGYKIVLENSGKSWNSGSAITVNDSKYTSFKGSNGAANTLYLPSGVKADRITLYSYVNGTGTNVSGWKEVNGTQEYAKIPMGIKDVSTATDPDVRVYSLDNASEIKFNTPATSSAS